MPATGLLVEFDVLYAHNKDDAPDYYIPFYYQKRYKGEVVDNKVVYCKSAADFIKLIRLWNNRSGNWLYVLK